MGRRRTQVILHLLSQADLIRLTKRGYVLKSAESPPDEVLEALLQTYVDRAAHDTDRLADMMHYAETTACRTQVIRSYFGEPEGDPCQRCDNCRNSAASEAAPPSTRESVTTVETIHGIIHTTAPETLPRLLTHPDDVSFASGDRVSHRRFGPGRVLDALASNVLVQFERVGKKTLRASFLKRT